MRTWRMTEETEQWVHDLLLQGWPVFAIHRRTGASDAEIRSVAAGAEIDPLASHPEEVREEARVLASSGVDVNAIAELYGIDQSTAYAWVALARRGYKRRVRRGCASQVYVAGLSRKAVGEILGCTRQNIGLMLRRLEEELGAPFPPDWKDSDGQWTKASRKPGKWLKRLFEEKEK